MKRHPLILLASAVMAASLLTACSPGGTNTPTTTPPAGTPGTGTTAPSTSAAPVTITYWHAFSSDGQEVSTLEKTIIPAFEAANPGITVQAVAVPYDQLHQKLITGTAGGQLPDVVRSDIIWVPELANLGVLEPLDQTMPAFQDLSKQVFPGPLATNKWKDHYYGLPLDTNTLTLLYSPKNLTSWGVTLPTTWDDLKAIAPTLKGKGVTAYCDGGLSGWNLLPMIWSFGGSLTDDAVTTATGHLNSPETVAAISYLLDMYKAGYTCTNFTDNSDSGVPFHAGQAATIPGGPWMFPIFAGQYPDFDLNAAPIPSGPGGSISVVGGEDIVMTASSQHKDAAAKFIAYCLSQEAQLAMAKVGQMPVLSSLGPQLTQIQPYYAAFVQQLATARPRPATPAWPAIDRALQDALQGLFVSGGDTKPVLDALATQVDALLAQYK